VPRQKSLHVDNPIRVGERLREARANAGLSQRDLAVAGCTAAYISRIEAGDRIPSLQLLRRLGELLGVSADYLATGVDRIDESTDLVQAEAALRFGETEVAERIFRDALARPLSRADQARAEAGLGQIAFAAGDHHEAVASLERALELAGSSPGHEFAAVADSLGRAYATLGDYESAIGLFERWLADAREREDLIEIVRFSILLANTFIDTGLFERAQELLGSTLALSTDWADPFLRARLYWSQSRLHGVRQESALAVRYAKKAIEILELTEHTTYLARAHQLLAFLEIEQGNAEEALALLQRGRELFGDEGGRVELAKFKLEEARALATVGRAEEAGALAMEVLPLLGETAPQDAGRAYLTLADVFEQIGDRARALELCELAVESLEQHGLPYLSEAYARLGELHKAEGRTEEALEQLEKALAARQRAPRPL
jgi:tetratricopeptide (TPR) repeat protein